MFTKYERILVAVDGSKNAELALKTAVEMSTESKGTLYILAVIDESAISHSSYAFSKVLAEERDVIEKEMADHVQYASEQGVSNIVSIVEIGNPKELIATTIPDKDTIDLVVVGATGKGQISQSTIGSTTNHIVQHAPCNVLVVKNN